MQKPIQKKTRGRQKIEIKPIQVQSNLQVTFSKRRSGLIKKASELSLLCGSQVAVIAFSPGNKAFAFGYPDVDAVLNRYLAETGNDGTAELAGAKSDIASNSSSGSNTCTTDPQVQQMNKEYLEALEELETEKKRKAIIEERAKKGKSAGHLGRFWWDEPVDHMGLEELEEHRKALRELRRNVTARVTQFMAADGRHLVDVNGSGGGSGGASTSGGDYIGNDIWVNVGDGLF